MKVNRQIPALEAGEREMLSSWLEFQRDTLALKCEGLTDEQLRERAVLPSRLSLLGLVRHMAEGERQWFRMVLGRQELDYRYYTDDDPDADAEFDVENGDVAEGFAYWREECADARARVEAAPSLDCTGTQNGKEYSLRWIMIHMIEEYARHLGHADLIRERIDGVTGV
jgi:uncharacterized damage-inducible protein DinB